MSKIVVTGGCGFIGSHLVDRLVDLNHKVIVIDDLSASENEEFYFNEKAQYHKNDICDKDKIEPLFENVDYIFHLAAESRIQPAIQNPSRAYNVNVIGTLNILELSKKYNIKRIMYSSTSSIYGLTNRLPTSEDTPVDCLNPYAHSKYLGEELFRQYWKTHQVDSVIFRYFNVFGEKSPVKGQYAPVIGIFLNQMRNNMDLTIVGDGLKKRDFIYVGDVVTANLNAMMFSGNLESRIINIGSGNNITIKEMANLISDNHLHIDNRMGEAENTLADISVAKNLLDFIPKTNVINWIKSELE
jgi:UDP-glucose 4-epimerase